MTEIELRQSFHDKMNNYRPSWILRWGLSWTFVFFCVLILVSGFIKFPDIVPAKAEITTINPPAHLVSHVNGKIKKVLKREGEKTIPNEALVLLESTIKWDDIKILENKLLSVEPILTQDNKQRLYPPEYLDPDLKLGEIQSYYADFLNAYCELYRFFDLNIYKHEKDAIIKQIEIQNKYYNQQKKKKFLMEEQFGLIKNKLHADSVLYLSGGITKSELDDSYGKYLQFETTLADITMNIINGYSILKQLEHDLIKIETERKSKEQILYNEVNKRIQLLKSSLDNWKKNYVLTSPIKGMVSYTIFWVENQNVRAGDEVVSIIPEDTLDVKVRIQFPVHNSGKVNNGQRVNIKLDNYPYHEFGMLIGKVQHISKVPNQQMYSGDVILENGLTTSYKKKLPFDQELVGNAEILTDDISLLSRFLGPIRALFNGRMKG